jgi:hypothetical protein
MYIIDLSVYTIIERERKKEEGGALIWAEQVRYVHNIIPLKHIPHALSLIIL